MEKSLEHHEKSGIGTKNDVGATTSMIASCLLKQGEFEKALEYQDKAIEVY
jgi:pentatricopeptide repeat protein